MDFLDFYLGMECDYNMLCSVLFVCVFSWLGDAYYKVCCAGLLNVEFPKLLIGSLHFSYLPFIILYAS